MLLKISQAAEIMAICPKQVRRMINTGKLAAVRTGEGPRSDRILKADIDKAIEKCRYINAGQDGGSSSSIEVNALAKVLDRALPKRTRKNSKRKSSPALRIVQKETTT